MMDVLPSWAKWRRCGKVWIRSYGKTGHVAAAVSEVWRGNDGLWRARTDDVVKLPTLHHAKNHCDSKTRLLLQEQLEVIQEALRQLDGGEK